MTDTPDQSARTLARSLGWASLALGVPPLAAPDQVARAVGVDDSPVAPKVIRAVGVRELLHAATLLAGPPSAVWGRVAGDVLDLAFLGRALTAREKERRVRVAATLAVVAGITAADVLAGLRVRAASQHGKGRPGPLQLQASVTVRRPPESVYAYWRDFENLPTFMRHLESVSDGDNGVSTWVAKAPLRRTVKWEAEITGDEPARRISWKSRPKADVDNSGTVHFAPTHDGTGTELRVTLHYDLPAGAVGRAIAKLWGEEPEQQVRDDLRRFKQIMETGEVTRSDGLPDGPDAAHQVKQRPAQPVGANGGRR